MTVDLTTGNQSVVTSTADAEIYAGIHGEDNYCMRTPPEASMPNANTLMVGPANFSQNGHQIRLKGNTEFTIPTGVQAQKRSNLCILRTTKTRDEETMAVPQPL